MHSEECIRNQCLISPSCKSEIIKNFSFLFRKMAKIQPIRVAYAESQTAAGISIKRIKERIKQKSKVSTVDIEIKRLVLKVIKF